MSRNVEHDNSRGGEVCRKGCADPHPRHGGASLYQYYLLCRGRTGEATRVTTANGLMILLGGSGIASFVDPSFL